MTHLQLVLVLVFGIAIVFSFFGILLVQKEIQAVGREEAVPFQHRHNANRSLVIIMGNLRGGEKAWQTLYTNVLDENNADLALMIGEESPNATQSLYPNNTLSKRARYVWTFPEYGDWADAVDLINGTGWRQDLLPRFTEVNSSGVFGGIKGCPGSGAIIFMIRWFLNQRLQHDKIIDQYDRFVITRSDHYYQCPHIFADLDLNNNKMYIPEGTDYGGYTDRHLVVSRENIYEALDIFPELLRRPYILDDGRKNWLGANPEYILKRVWGEHNLTVSYLKRTFFTTATANDTTRWRKAGDPVPGVEGLYKKYRNEYTMAQFVCLEERFDRSKLSQAETAVLDKWCGHCRGGWGKCNFGYLYDKYNASIIDSKLDITKQGLCPIVEQIEENYVPETISRLPSMRMILFVSTCAMLVFAKASAQWRMQIIHYAVCPVLLFWFILELFKVGILIGAYLQGEL